MKTKKSPIPLRIISPLLLLLWMGLIFFFSSQTATESSAVSSGLIETVVRFLMPSISPATLKNVVSISSFFVRKGAHFCVFAMLGVFSFLSVATYEKLKLLFRFFISAFISVAYAVSDEYHQTFVNGRSCELRDVLIDSSGAICGILVSIIIYIIHKHKGKSGGKMRKKKYIELTEELQKRLHSEKLKTDELQAENKELADELAALNSELFALREKLTQLEQQKEPAEQVAEPEPQIVPDEQTKDEPLPEPQLSDDVNFGAKSIGKIVLSSAEYCNKLTASGSDPSVKELVNLILGRTEVAKSEILRISTLQIDPQEKQQAMEREMNEAEDYFKSVMAQK